MVVVVPPSGHTPKIQDLWQVQIPRGRYVRRYLHTRSFSCCQRRWTLHFVFPTPHSHGLSRLLLQRDSNPAYWRFLDTCLQTLTRSISLPEDNGRETLRSPHFWDYDETGQRRRLSSYSPGPSTARIPTSTALIIKGRRAKSTGERTSDSASVVSAHAHRFSPSLPQADSQSPASPLGQSRPVHALDCGHCQRARCPCNSPGRAGPGRTVKFSARLSQVGTRRYK